MIFFPTTIPDGTLLRDERGTRLAVFNPRWWRADRWLFWLWMVAFGGRARGTAEFSYIAADGEGTHLECVEMRVYEVGA